ncbi:MAG: cupredoxin domain-containing protein [Thermoplasmatota archaeon]
MKKVWVWVLIVVGAIVVLFVGYDLFTTQSNGTNDYVTIHVGTAPNGAFTMYMRCTNATGGATCDSSNQTTITVHARDRVTLDVIDDDGAGHVHDFNIQGTPYSFYPNSPEMELQQAEQSTTITAWATGSYHILCELAGHDQAGMHGTFVVV